jgi:hypothetical protein
MGKFFSYAIIALLICGGALWYFAANPTQLNEFVRKQIEQYGSFYTGETVKVNTVSLELLKGKGSIQQLSITNPEGYSQPKALTLGEITLEIDLTSLNKEPIVIKDFVINDLKAFVEITKSGNANLKDIIDYINQQLPKSDTVTPKQEKTKEPKIRVEHLRLAEVGLALDLSQLGNKVHQETLPAIDLGEVGGKAGLPASELGIEIAKRVVDNIWQQVKAKQKEQLLEKAKEKLEQEKAKAKEKLQQEKEKLEDKVKEKAKDKLKGLLDKIGQ